MEDSFFQTSNQQNKGERKVETMTMKRGKKKNNKLAPKKPPQRGLGVAQLERMRMQEGWKKKMMSEEIDQVGQNYLHHQQQQQQPPPQLIQFPYQPFSYLDQSNLGGGDGGVVPFPRYAPVNYAGGGGGNVESGFGFVPYNVGNGGFVGCGGGCSSDSAVLPGLVVSNRKMELVVDRMQMRNADQIMNRYGTETPLTELPSSQRQPHCSSDICQTCHKKKRFDGDALGFKKEKAKMQMNGQDSLGLSLGPITTIYEEDEVEVVAFHRKRNGGVPNVVMEYEFFPNGNNSNNNNTAKVGSNTDFSVGEASAAPSNVNSLDLSLKLSL